MLKLSLVALLAITPFAAQAKHDGHTHCEMLQSAPIESGQAAFAAIQEIVAQLEADPHTDWSEVNIGALRQHLIDMDRVTLEANVESQKIENGAQMVITGAGDIAASIKRTTLSHARTMNGVDGWIFDAEETSDGIRLTVTNQNDAEKIRALGYAGVMARGAHHQQHHLMIAKGTTTGH